MGYLQRQIDEIRSSQLLSWYGAILAFCHVLNFLKWRETGFSRLRSFYLDPYKVCWPFWESCYQMWSSLPLSFFLYADWILLISSLICMGLFLKRLTQWAYGLFIFCWILKAFLLFSEYRMMGNYHYMYQLAMLFFLFVPQKISTLKLLIIGFYVAAGSLKFNVEWLSGEAMIRPAWIGGVFLIYLQAYVIIFECVLIWGMMSKNRWIFWGAWSQAFSFHVFSWHIVGFFYPCIMCCLLSLFALEKWKRWETSFRLHPLSYITLFLFVTAQAVPHMMPGDSAVTGEGRLFALNMFDAHTDCDSLAIAKYKNTYLEIQPRYLQFGVRVHCDPIVHMEIAKFHCRNGAESVRLTMYSKRKTDLNYQHLIDEKNICDKNYAIFRPNDWIRK